MLKKHAQRRKDPPYLSLTQVIYLPLPIGQVRAHILPGWLIETNCGKEVNKKRVAGAFRPKPAKNGVTKISFDRKDVALLSTSWRSGNQSN